MLLLEDSLKSGTTPHFTRGEPEAQGGCKLEKPTKQKEPFRKVAQFGESSWGNDTIVTL